MEAESTEYENLKQILEHAKIPESNLLPNFNSIYFSNQCLPEYKLLELNEELLLHMKKNETLYIRGDVNDEVVICTDSKTFVVKEAEISNSMLLVPQAEFICENNVEIGKVNLCTNIYWEVREVTPHFRHILTRLLLECPYRGREIEAENLSSKKYGIDDLLNIIPASRKELMEALGKMRICEIADHMRLLDFNFIVKITTDVLNLIEENSWSWKHVDVASTIETLSSLYSVEILNRWFEIFAEPFVQPGFFSLKEIDICRLFAEIILRAVDKIYLKEFEQTWLDSVPHGMQPTMEMLKGLTIIDTDARSQFLRYFPLENLSDDQEKRFVELFARKQRWRVHLVGSGSYGVVYHAVDVSNPANRRAIKIENAQKKEKARLLVEIEVMKALGECEFSPHLIEHGMYFGSRYFVMTLLGPDLSRVLLLQPFMQFTYHEIAQFIGQMLSSVQAVHNVNFVHRDIKVSNFAFKSSHLSRLVIFDFGSAKRYRSSDGQLVSFLGDVPFIGNPLFASMNALSRINHAGVPFGKDQCRVDDLWSLLYVLVILFTGSLPWQHASSWKSLIDIKMTTTKENLLSRLPCHIENFYDYLNTLRFEDEPNYYSLRSLFEQLRQYLTAEKFTNCRYRDVLYRHLNNYDKSEDS
uniref:Sister chromatid cohesion protein DCC1 n=1 Tax=Romanomermis culicivorax TaxID=13658 RepID=A0A915JZM7_ROMCU